MVTFRCVGGCAMDVPCRVVIKCHGKSATRPTYCPYHYLHKVKWVIVRAAKTKSAQGQPTTERGAA